MNATETSLPASVLTTKQVITLPWKSYSNRSAICRIRVEIRYDDACGNGHNSFGITGETQESRGGRWCDHSCGMLHGDIERHFPELAPLLKWHLCSSDGPMHYVANTRYHIEQKQFDFARATAIWPEATDEFLTALLAEGKLDAMLKIRLPTLMDQFKAAVESLGMVY